MNRSTTAYPSTKTAEKPAADERAGGPHRLPAGASSVQRWRSALMRRGYSPSWGRPALLVLLALLLAGLGAALAYLQATPAPTLAGIDLPEEPPSLNLNLTSAEAPPSAIAAAPESESDRAQVVVPELGAPARAAPLAVAAAVPEQKAPEPVIATPSAMPAVVMTIDAGNAAPELAPPAIPLENCYAIRTPHRGDSPMIRTWNALGLPLVLAGALAVPAAAGQAAEPNRDDVIIRDLRELRSAVEALTKVVNEFRSASLNTDLEIQRNKGEIAEIRRTITQLRQDLESLSQRQATERRSAYQPTPQTPTGRIRLVNTYMQSVTVALNGRAYTLLPGQTRAIESMPVGPFTYEVLGIVGATNRTLDANETFTITVHPS
jgi:hypothetical protein